MPNDNHDELGRFASAPAGLAIHSVHGTKKAAHLVGMSLRRSGTQAFVMRGDDAVKHLGFKGLTEKHYVVYHGDGSSKEHGNVPPRAPSNDRDEKARKLAKLFTGKAGKAAVQRQKDTLSLFSSKPPKP